VTECEEKRGQGISLWRDFRFELYNGAVKTYKRCVLKEQAVIWLIAALVALGAAFGLTTYFSEDARLRRRRRKSHAKVISKARRPVVKFSVRPPRDK
jgi:hypothetical protein